MANSYSIEIERNNVTFLAQFLRYVRQQCEKKGIYMEIDRDEFEKAFPTGKLQLYSSDGKRNAIPPAIGQ